MRGIPPAFSLPFKLKFEQREPPGPAWNARADYPKASGLST